MRIEINAGTAIATRDVTTVDYPTGAEVKRKLAMLDEGHTKFREDLRVFWNTWQQLTNQVNSITVIKGEKGDKGDQGEPGPRGSDGDSPVIVAELPSMLPGAWYRFWRRWLLGVMD